MSPRLPGRHDQPVTPLQMSVTDAVVFAQQIASGFGGQAPWRRLCSCHHSRTQHRNGTGRCRRCRCDQLRLTEHEQLVLWLHPDAINYLPEDVYVLAAGTTYEPLGPDGKGGVVMGVQYVLARDLGIGSKAVHSGVRKPTHVFTDEPEDWHDRPHEGTAADERLDRPKEDDE